MKDIKITTLTGAATPRAQRLRGKGTAAGGFAATAGGSGLTLTGLTSYFVTREEAAEQTAADFASYVSEVGASGELVTWRRGGELSSFTVPYAVRCAEVRTSSYTAIDAATVSSTDRLGVFSGLAPQSTGFPAMSSAWCNTLLNIGYHENGTAAQLFFAYGADMHFRSEKSEAWRKVLDSANYGATVDATHLRRDGEQPMLGDLPMNGHRVYLDEARTVALWYDAEADCVRCNKSIVADGNITAYEN